MKLIHRTLAGVLLAAGFTAQASAEKVVLKVAHFLPAVAIAQTKMMEPWCEKINKESNGQIECQIYPAMQLGGSPAQLLTHARDGIADVVWTLPGYTLVVSRSPRFSRPRSSQPIMPARHARCGTSQKKCTGRVCRPQDDCRLDKRSQSFPFA
ncbi:hypothetical protein [Neopusillimonas aromaticivorans]|uniref:hypothetical protein n=1 Tax=Neopusillimonas aromaticivorans TaxID=2979868 RepID=UPI0025966806|nr:hypothetical protein [Neopusillimonas aromaticivorans]WJJ92826.1 hypothetical protein N7E01_11370 [Neopusillimonas aromaticivorans]